MRVAALRVFGLAAIAFVVVVCATGCRSGSDAVHPGVVWYDETGALPETKGVIVGSQSELTAALSRWGKRPDVHIDFAKSYGVVMSVMGACQGVGHSSVENASVSGATLELTVRVENPSPDGSGPFCGLTAAAEGFVLSIQRPNGAIPTQAQVISKYAHEVPSLERPRVRMSGNL